MFVLYMRPTCHYCVRVLRVVDELGITVQLKDIGELKLAEELIDRGGKRQVPYLVDSECNIEMYESEDIMEHLRTTHSKAQ